MLRGSVGSALAFCKAGPSSYPRFIISEKLDKAISAARKSDAARKGDAGISDAAIQSDANKSRLPAMVPQPVAPPANPTVKKNRITNQTQCRPPLTSQYWLQS